MGRKLLTSPGVADTCTFLMNTWNTPLESYQQRVYKDTLPTVNHLIQLVENPIPAVVISVEAARVENAILLDELTSEVALEEPGIGSTDLDIPIDNNCTADELYIGMPGRSSYYKDEGDERDEHDAIPTASRQRRPAIELDRSECSSSDVGRYVGEDADDADQDADE